MLYTWDHEMLRSDNIRKTERAQHLFAQIPIKRTA
jgi:hypothetical protein